MHREPPPPMVDLDRVPQVDLSRHTVPLKHVVFDTFDGSFLPLPEAAPEVRSRLLDAIPPIYGPGYGGPDDLPWLRDDDLVVGYLSESGAYAYPLKVLNSRELVNDEIDGEPVLVTYCPLCASAVVYSRELDGRTLLFGNTSALYQSDLVMFDHQTGSYWFQVAGEAIVGTLTGKRLRPLPSTTTTWGRWKGLHPGTRLLVSDAGERFTESHAVDPYAELPPLLDRGEFRFPVSKERLDARLRASEIVVVVEAGEAAKAYPPNLVGDAAVNDEIGGEAVVLFSREQGFATAFRSTAGGRRLTFRVDGDSVVDEETESRWSEAGEAVSGPLRGTRLEPLPVRRAFWFSIALARPGIDLYLP